MAKKKITKKKAPAKKRVKVAPTITHKPGDVHEFDSVKVVVRFVNCGTAFLTPMHEVGYGSHCVSHKINEHGKVTKVL